MDRRKHPGGERWLFEFQALPSDIGHIARVRSLLKAALRCWGLKALRHDLLGHASDRVRAPGQSEDFEEAAARVASEACEVARLVERHLVLRSEGSDYLNPFDADKTLSALRKVGDALAKIADRLSGGLPVSDLSRGLSAKKD